MSARKAILTMLLVIVMAFGSGFDLLFRIGYTILALLAVAYLWSWASERGLELTRHTRTLRAKVGDQWEEKFVLRNDSLLPKLWVEVQDGSTLPSHRVGRVVNIGGKSRCAWVTSTPCLRRGKYNLGPTTIRTGDPLGLFPRARLIKPMQQLVVYPATVSLGELNLWGGELPGGATAPRWTHTVTPNAASVRDYMPGDSLNRIHWPSTARTAKLMVKEFDADPTADFWLLLDLDQQAHWGSGDDSTEEYAVTIAASMAAHFLNQGRGVGLVAYGQRHEVIPPDRGSRQMLKLLEELAVLRAQGQTPLGEIIAAEVRRFSHNNSVLAITASVEEAWIGGLRHLALRGTKTAAVLLEPASFGGPTSALVALATLATEGIPTLVVKKGDALGQALASPASHPSGRRMRQGVAL